MKSALKKNISTCSFIVLLEYYFMGAAILRKGDSVPEDLEEGITKFDLRKGRERGERQG